jgi:hypothetical protein
MHYCPNCNAATAPTANNCGSCGASFAEGSAWKPLTTLEATHPPVTATNLILVAMGISFLIATFFPIGSYILQKATGGVYGSGGRLFSFAQFLLLSYISNYLPLTLLVALLLHYFKVIQRVPYKYRGSSLFGLGVILILAYAAARVLAVTRPNDGAAGVLISISTFVFFPAIVVLIVAVLRLCVGYGKGLTIEH